MTDWVADLRVGDRVAFRYNDHVEAGKPPGDLPIVEGRILSLPSGGDRPYYELEVSDDEARAAGSWVDEEAAGLPYLASENELIGRLPHADHNGR